MSIEEQTHNSQIFENVWQKAVAGMDAVVADDDDRCFLKALVMGGSVAAESAVSACPEITKLWGEGNEAAATRLNQLFSLVVLGQLYRWIKDNPPEGNPNTVPPEINVTRLVQVFGGDQEEGIKDYEHFDRQFDCDMKKHGNLTHTSIMLLARCGDICGHQCMDWSKVKFPVVEMTHLVKGAIIDGAPLRSIQDINAMQAGLNAGIQAMTRFYAGA